MPTWSRWHYCMPIDFSKLEPCYDQILVAIGIFIIIMLLIILITILRKL